LSPRFVAALRGRAVTPHIAIYGNLRKSGKQRATAVDLRFTRHPGYAIPSDRRRPMSPMRRQRLLNDPLLIVAIMAGPENDRRPVDRVAAGYIQTLVADPVDFAVDDGPSLIDLSVAGPENDGCSIRPVTSGYVQTLAFYASDQTRRYKGPLLVLTAVTRPQDNGSAIARAATAYIQALVA